MRLVIQHNNQHNNVSNYFIDKHQIKTAIDYFRKVKIIKTPQSTSSFCSFFIMRHLGMTRSNKYYFSKNCNDKTKKKERETLWRYCALFNINENVQNWEHLYIFPFCLHKDPAYLRGHDFYNCSTPVRAIRTRMRDGLRNSNRVHPYISTSDENKKDSNKKTFYLAPDYINQLKKLWTGTKISFFNFSIWLYRFSGFPLKEPTSESFTRIIKKCAYKYLNLTTREFNTFFKDDFYGKTINYTKDPMSGKELRSFSGVLENKKFKPKLKGTNNKDIQITSNPNKSSNMIPTFIVRRYSQLTGTNPDLEQICNTLKVEKQLILVGVPGVGKTFLIRQLINKYFKDRSRIIQFHPNYSYENFIEGKTIKHTDTDRIQLVPTPGILTNMIFKAIDDPNNSYLLVIDEINRGNVPAIFGETIEILDRGYKVDLMNPVKHNGKTISSIQLPENLYIIGAMNSSDKSVAPLDSAIKRRFAFINLVPNYEVVSQECKYKDINLGNVLQTINQRLLNQTNNDQKQLGQSYFLNNNILSKDNNNKDNIYTWTDKSLQIQFNTKILPAINTYAPTKVNAIVGSKLSKSIQDTTKFVQAFDNEFNK